MSLLPIIYSSLLITGGILFIAFTVSYISYKLKNNGESVKNEFTSPKSKSNNIRSLKQTSQLAAQLPNSPNTRPDIKYRRAEPVASVQLAHASKSKNIISSRQRDFQRTSFPPRQFNPTLHKKEVNKIMETKPDYMKKSSVGKIKNRLVIVNPINNLRSEPLNYEGEKIHSDNQSNASHLHNQNYRDKKTETLKLKSTLFAQTGT